MLVPGLVYCRSLPSKPEQSGCMPLRHQAWLNIARLEAIVAFFYFTSVTAVCQCEYVWNWVE